MRTLLMTQVAPAPGDAGPRIKTYYALRTLAQEHDVELFSFVRSDAERAAADALRAYCANVTVVPLQRRRVLEPYYLARGWSSGTPFLVERDDRREFRRLVSDRLAGGSVDVLHADQLSMAQYLPLAHGQPIATVFDAHNAVWELVRDQATRQPTPAHRVACELEWRLLRRFEGRAARVSDLTLAVSTRDRDALERAAGVPVRSAVIPIGIEARERAVAPVNPTADRILSVATMHYPPNAEALRWFRDAIWPLLRHLRYGVGLDVAGARAPEDLVNWGRQDSGVRVHGYVTDHTLEELYRQAAAFIVPLRSGSGVRVKVLEAMAAGVAVVSTSVGIDGLDLISGEHLLVADDPESFALAVAQLLESPELRASMTRAARERVLERYDWRQCCRPLLDAYRMLGASALPQREMQVAVG